MPNPTCALCDKPPTSRGAKYCVKHRTQWRENQRAAIRAWNMRQWAERKATGIDTTHGGEAAEKRGRTIAESNREKPRKKRLQE